MYAVAELKREKPSRTEETPEIIKVQKQEMAATVILEFIPRTPSACKLQTPSMDLLVKMIHRKLHVEGERHTA